MTLQLRLTLGFLLLFALLGLLAFAGLQALTRDMREALGETVSEVSHSLIAVLRDERVVTQSGTDSAHWVQRETVQLRPDGTPTTDAAPVQREMRVVINGRELSADEIKAMDPATLPDSVQQVLQRPLPDGLKIEVQRDASGGRPALFVRGLGSDQNGIPIPISESRATAAIDGFRDRLLLGLVLLMLLGAALASLMARRIAAPLRALSAAAQRVGHGELDGELRPEGPPELRQSIEAFNRMARDLQRLREETAALQADRELAELGEIGRGLAHSLRNPLHALGLSLDALSAGGDAERGAALAQSGREQLARIDQALRGFLALSASAGAAPESVALDEVVDDVVLEASQRAQGRVRFERERGDCRLPGVAAELRIVLHALLINALEASPEGGLIRLRVSPSAHGGARIEIEDDGPGLSAEVRARLFQPHVSSKPTGAGMGLYLAERLVRLRYRGTLELQDKSPQGTRAVLQLNPRETAR